MSNKNKWLHCRLAEDDFARMQVHAEELELSPSEYVRYLIRIPIGDDGEFGERSAIVFDTSTCSKIYNELVRWGHHYNQAVHALNTVQLFVNRGGSNTEYFFEQIEKANRLLEKTENGRKQVQREIESLRRYTVIGG